MAINRLMTSGKRWRGMAIVPILMLLSAGTSSWAYPLPGTQITNIASGDYQDEQGNTLVIDSNPVSLTIQKVQALTLVSNQSQVGLIGAKLNFPHILTNTGNVADTYRLTLAQSTTDNYDLTGMAVYADRDQNGIPDDNINLLNSTVNLDVGQSLALVVAGSIPTTVNKDQIANFTLTATSTQAASVTQSINDTAKVIDDAVLLVTKSQSISTGSGNQQLIYTLTYTNNGSSSGKLVVNDILDSGLSYAGNATWSNGSGTLTDANDVESGTNAGIKYQVINGSQIQFEVASIPALSTGSVSFTVTVADTKRDSLSNTASYSQYTVGGTTPLRTTNTNTVTYRNLFLHGVVANITASSASNLGEPNQSPDNLLVKPSINAGQELLFDNYIWNTGNTIDSFNLTLNTAGLPSCASVKLYASDGRTQLVDTNNDGIIDTGPIAASAARAIKVGIQITTDCTSTQAIYADLLATSVADTTKTDAVRDQISMINNGITDLYNADTSGIGVNAVDNNGQPWLTKTIVNGKTVFPLVVANTANIPNNYNLYASTSAIDLSNRVTQLADGWKVTFYEGDATCSTLGNVITNTGTIAANASKAYCAVVEADNSVSNTSLAIWFAVMSPINSQGDIIKDQVEVVDATKRSLTLENDQQGKVDTGGTVVYLHTLKNIGTLTEGTALGEVLLTVVPLDSQDNFNYTLYYDANNNGILDSTDPIANDLATVTNNLGLAPDQSVQLLLKVQAPLTADYGTSSQADIVVTPTSLLQGLSANEVKNTDYTTINANQLRLVKAQAKTTCSGSQLDSLSYTVTTLEIKPNECVAYRLTVSNDGSTTANTVSIADTVPAYTTLQNSPAPSVSKGSVTVKPNGAINASIGALAAAEQASLYFLILVNP